VIWQALAELHTKIPELICRSIKSVSTEIAAMAKNGKNMLADNTIYNTYATEWWHEDSFLHLLKTGLNPARFGFFLDVANKLGLKMAGLQVLDVGCGGGILSEEFAGQGCMVKGIDLSAASIDTARKHARQQQKNIEYLVASGERLPFRCASFDVVVCCDVLEHVTNLTWVISEVARVLKPGGLYLFDTINRTRQSYIENILIAQELPFTRFFAPGTHAWQQFIQPDEIRAQLESNGLQLRQLTGLQPGIPSSDVFREILKLKMGKSNFATFGSRLKFQTGAGLDSSYIGYAERSSFTTL
jgi:2-polyprenyl-6-hydroxyphenyl methylase / 3-demethylubiquinone-9 3-methyltransferase